MFITLVLMYVCSCLSSTTENFREFIYFDKISAKVLHNAIKVLGDPSFCAHFSWEYTAIALNPILFGNGGTGPDEFYGYIELTWIQLGIRERDSQYGKRLGSGRDREIERERDTRSMGQIGENDMKIWMVEKVNKSYWNENKWFVLKLFIFWKIFDFLAKLVRSVKIKYIYLVCCDMNNCNIYRPSSVDIDKEGRLFICDTTNCRVCVYTNHDHPKPIYSFGKKGKCWKSIESAQLLSLGMYL